MARRIVFTDSGFWKYSWAHLVMSLTQSCRWVMQCRLRARRPRASNKGLRPCPLRTVISPVSLNLLMMLCTVEDEICKAFAIWCWRTLFLKYSTIFLHTLSQIGEPLPSFTFERLCLSNRAFTRFRWNALIRQGWRIPIHFEWGDVILCRTELWLRWVPVRCVSCLQQELKNVQFFERQCMRQPIKLPFMHNWQHRR